MIALLTLPGRGRRFACLVILVAAAFGGLVSPAKAGENEKAVARARYETATRYYELREYDKALAEYKAAYLALPDPAFLFNIGQCQRKLGQDQEAINFFQLYLKKAPLDDPNRRQAEARIHDLESEARAKAEARPTAPLPSPAPPPEPAVTSPSGPAITASASVEPGPGDGASPGNGKRALRIAGIACGGVGVASVATAIYYYTRATSLSDRVTNAQAPSAADDQAGRDAVTKQWIFYSVGAGAIATGALLYALGLSHGEPGRSVAEVTPLVGPGSLGISARGAF